MIDVNRLSLPESYAALTGGEGAGLARRLFELARDEDLGRAEFAARGVGADLTGAAT
ncbi:MAG: hypothetical protein H7Y88_06460, partial [Phycisphaerales bacterium]|nr:hypothetical protein [Phycisphaerales bacterium]